MILNDSQQMVLDTVNRFGIIKTEQIYDFLQGEFSKVYLYKILKELYDFDLLEKMKIKKYNVHRITQIGNKLSSNSMQNVYQTDLSILQHHLLMNEYLINQYLELSKNEQILMLNIKTEREIMFENITVAYENNYRQATSSLVRTLSKKIPDGIISFEINGQKRVIAHELELTQKYKPRYVTKMKDYREEFLNGNYTNLIYICRNQSIINKISEVLEENDITLPIQFRLQNDVFN